jgi:lipoprotein-anchoring transpeptidase ErfK/SrfK
MIGMEGGITVFGRRTIGIAVFLLLLSAVSPALAIDQQRGGQLYEPLVDKIVVGVKDFRLVAISNNRVVFDYKVAVGADTGPTPTGQFTVVSRLKNPWYTPDDEPAVEPGSPKNPLGNRWIGISKPSYGLHGTNEPNSIGTKASEGCLRLRNQKIAKLYKHVPRGTPVIIKKRIPMKYTNLRTVKHIPETDDSSEEG